MDGFFAMVRLDGVALDERELAVLLGDGPPGPATIRTEQFLLCAEGWAGTHAGPDGVTVAGAAHVVGRDAFAPDLRALPSLALVAELYRRYGSEVFTHLEGQFCLAVADPGARRLLLATDRFSTRVVYHAERNGRLLFSSRLRLLERLPDLAVDAAAILEYLLHAAIPHPRTPFAGIAKLEPGHVLTADASGVRTAAYWDMPYREQANGRVTDWAARLREQLEAAVARYVVAESDPENVGAFLSGGTDSSTVAGMMATALGAPTRTFSIGYREPGYDELGYARAAVHRFGFRQHEHIVTPQEALAAVPQVVAYYEEPFGNSSALPTYACARVARAHGVRVLFAGDGGDELFAGNTRYRSDKILGLYQHLPRPLRRYLTDPVLGAIPDHWPGVGLVPRYVRRSNLPNPHRFFSYNLLLTAPLATLLTPDFLAAVEPGQLLARAEEHYRRPGSATAELNRLMYLDLKLAIADNDVRKVSGMAELAGVEVRYPLFDVQLAEFSGRIPSHLKLRGLTKRYVFKRALADFLPAQILAKPKHGFGVPIALWMKTDAHWRALVGDLLHDRRTRQRGYIQASIFDDLWQHHQHEQSAYYGDMLWPILMLELWHRARDGARAEACQ